MRHFTIVIIVFTLFSCNLSKDKNNEKNHPYLTKNGFSSPINGENAELYHLENKNGMAVYLTNFGARIVGLNVPDKDNKSTDVVLGFSKASQYNNPVEPYFGPIVGPFANRIANGKFSTSEDNYQLEINNGPNSLHGGKQGLHFVTWKAVQKDNSVTFSYTHADGKGGYPGNIAIQVVYSLLDDNKLQIDYSASTDKETIINLSNHAYFNLNGEGSGSILNHSLQIPANTYTPVNETLIPTGELATVKGTPFDFNTAKTIGQDINSNTEQLKFGKGYDHNFILIENKNEELHHAAKLKGDLSGITMDIYTTEPAIQFYSGNFMSEKITLKNGSKDSFRTGLCLEPQNYPDAPNHKNFPNSILKTDQTYKSTSIYSFTNN